jgi:glycylpeptide N-tetradecanoyltransferase
MVKADVPQVGKLLRNYLSRFDIVQTFDRDEEVEHWFLSGQGKDENGNKVGQVVWAYVVEVGPGLVHSANASGSNHAVDH